MGHLSGTGVWIHEIHNTEDGDIIRIAEKALQYKLSHVLVKIADGRSYHRANKNHFRGLCSELRARGIGVWVWQYIYGNAPAEEAQFAAKIANSLDADGFVIDAEKEYKGEHVKAAEYCKALEGSLNDDILVALSSFYLPEWHSDIPWEEFLNICDYNMPQIYWHQRNPEWAVNESFRQNSKFGVEVFPTIGAYTALFHGPNAMLRAAMESFRQGADGLNMWVWQTMGHGRWSVVDDIDEVFPNRQLKIVDRKTGEVIRCNPTVESGVTRVDLRKFSSHYGIEVYDRINEQNKVYTEDW